MKAAPVLQRTRGTLIRLTRSPRWLLPPTGAALTLVLLFGAMAIGIAIRSQTDISRLPGGGQLDYGRGLLGSFAPLRPDFIQSVLGDLIPLSPAHGGFSGTSNRGGRIEDPLRVLESHGFTNDDLASARSIPGIPYTARTSNRDASREPSEPSDCASVGGTVWYKYTPNRDLSLIAYTFGTDHAAALGVFSGSPGNLKSVACHTNTAGNALVGFSAKAGVSYLFQITAPLGGGNLVFSLDPHGTTSLASRSSTGEEANGGSGLWIALSGDGRYVAFSSSATNLGEGLDPTPCNRRDPFAYAHTGPCPQVYVRDRFTGKTELISATSSGQPGDSASYTPFMSANGRYIVYESAARNIDPADADGGYDLFVYDRVLRRTEKVPATSGSPVGLAQETFANLFGASISDDGRYVAFNSPASDLVEADTNGDYDVFVYDRQTGGRERASISSTGGEMLGRKRAGGLYPSISPDGRYVEFTSDSPTLLPPGEDTNGLDDVFLHDRLTRITERVSIGWRGQEGEGPTWAKGLAKTRISAGGRYVVFSSSASKLVPDDTNQGPDVFVRDRVARTTLRVSVASGGGEARGSTGSGIFHAPYIFSLSADGRYVTFDSDAPNLAPGDADQDWDVFLHDLFSRTTTLVTLTSSGSDASGQGPAISADGRSIAYVAGAVDRESDVAYGDTDVFVYEAPRLR